MNVKNGAATKKKILKVAAKLFSENGYKRVTTRDIASVVGISSPSIYYHFPSKNKILASLYKLYADEYRKALPDLDELLQLAETAPPHEVLMRAVFCYNEKVQGILSQILVTATREIGADPDSEQFIKEHIFDSVAIILKPLLERMVVLGKIKPLDLDATIEILAYYCFSAAALSTSSFGINRARYQADLSLVFSLVIPIEE
ncbi:MAG: TetR/AcrR family transcriptional regulator [Dehalococcoidia bacterium]|nr:TetR/AcrR family transcriptional regulator [Dehalococcoidia bacterium]